MPKTIITAPYFNAPEKKILHAFTAIAKSDADEVILRDITCQKREPSLALYKKVIPLLKEYNKKIILNTPIIARHHDAAFFEYISEVDFVEINNIGYLPFVENTPIILGPHLRMYNAMDTELFSKKQVSRFVVPYGLTKNQTNELAQEMKVPIELFVFGLEPIALSWNCFLASFLEKNRFNCKKSCFLYPLGMNLNSLDSVQLFKVMGTEVVSQKPYSILDDLKSLNTNPISHYRINPHITFSQETLTESINTLKKIIDGKEKLDVLSSIPTCNGTFYEKVPGYVLMSDSKCP